MWQFLSNLFAFDRDYQPALGSDERRCHSIAAAGEPFSVLMVQNRWIQS